MADFDIQNVIDQVSNQMIARLDPNWLTPDEYQEDCTILVEFNKIAAGMLLQEEQGIEIPGSAQPIPMDEALLTQALVLFAEGVYYAIIKCAEIGLVGDLKRNLMQNLAMEIYNQARQVVIATFGQEHTPEFQFSHEQQVDIIAKATEGYLVAYITDYERDNGPIDYQPAKERPATPQNAPAPMEQAPQADPATLPVAEAPAQMPEKSQAGATSHDKYGAVALLLTTLPPAQRARILKGFTVEEKELIEYYSYPQHLEQNLDLACVEAHLKRFREIIKKAAPAAKSSVQKGIARLVESYSPEKLLSYVKDERPLVKRYLEALYVGQAGRSGKHQARQALGQLPARIEEILYKYLSKRLEPS